MAFDIKDITVGPPVLMSGATPLLVVFLIRYLLDGRKKPNLPILGTTGQLDYRNVLLEGTTKARPHLLSLSLAANMQLTIHSIQTLHS